MSMTLDWLLVLGFAGQGCYGARFLIQWLASERRGESTIPVAFWYLSIAAALLLLVYAIARRDPVFIAGQSTGALIYVRNLVLIQRRRTTSA